MDAQTASQIAISGLQRLANDDELLMRFCNLTGILANDIREAAAEQHFLAGVLDFYLSHEPDLLAWTEHESIRPEEVVNARRTLSPEDRSGFE